MSRDRTHCFLVSKSQDGYLGDEDFNEEFEKDKKEESKSEEEGEIIYAYQGFSIMVQGNLMVASEDNNEEWLRKNVFHIRCTTKRNVCLVIIDNDMFENAVSMEMVQKLNLEMVVHLN